MNHVSLSRPEDILLPDNILYLPTIRQHTILILSCIKNKVIALYSYRGPALFLLTDNIDFPSFSPFFSMYSGLKKEK